MVYNMNEKISPDSENSMSFEQVEDTDGTELKKSNAKTNSGQKVQPEILCYCPLHCDAKISKEWRKTIYKQFQEISDHATQNQFIQRHMKIRSAGKRLWEDEVNDRKVQRRVTCKYLVPINASVMESYNCAKTLTFDTVDKLNRPILDSNNEIESLMKTSLTPSRNTNEVCDSPEFNLSPSISMDVNGHGSFSDRKSDVSDVNSPLSFHDSDSCNTFPEDMDRSDEEITPTDTVNYVEVCQKAFMNMYGVTEKRIRWQREKLILKSRIQAEQKKKELEEIDRSLILAKNLGAGCQPLFALLEKTNCLHLSDQIIGAIEADVALVNNFFQNQLWKPEDITKTIRSAHIEFDSLDTECD